jgi:hypothetical protein
MIELGKTEVGVARKRAKHFYSKHFSDGEAITPRTLENALHKASADMRPASWYNLKRYVLFDQSEKGFNKSVERLADMKNPMIHSPHMLKPAEELPPKVKRKKSVSEKDHSALFKAAKEKGDLGVMSALYMANKLGCRVSEMPLVRIIDGKVFVPSVKKSEKGDRGLDRLLELPEYDVGQIALAVQAIAAEVDGKAGKMRRIRSRLETLHKKVFPRRQGGQINLYSYRHQLGSDLKGSGMSRENIAYIMGHQSTVSVEVYGNSRGSRRGREVAPGVAQEVVNNQVRSNHTPPPSAVIKTVISIDTDYDM